MDWTDFTNYLILGACLGTLCFVVSGFRWLAYERRAESHIRVTDPIRLSNEIRAKGNRHLDKILEVDVSCYISTCSCEECAAIRSLFREPNVVPVNTTEYVGRVVQELRKSYHSDPYHRETDKKG